MTSDLRPTRFCPVCGGHTPRLFLEKGAQQLHRCSHCSMVYAGHLPDSLACGDHYTRHGDYYVSADKLRGDFSPMRYQRELRWFTRFCAEGSLLDVGCSTGGFMSRLTSLFPGRYEACGVEISEPAIAHARSLGLRVEEGDLLELDTQGKRFDAVTFWAVLEHVMDPAGYLRKAAGLLRLGGWCFVLVPNLDSLAVRLLGYRYRYFMEEHINWFDATTLRKLFGPGWEIHRLTTTHFNPVVIAQDALSGGKTVPAAQRAALLKCTTDWKERVWLWPLRQAYHLTERCLGQLKLGDNLLIVAQKIG